LDLDYRLCLVLVVPLRDSQNAGFHPEPDSAVLLESGAPAFAERIFLASVSNVARADACQRILFLSEKIFIVLSFKSHSIEFTCWVLC
jgi:hypothetical protein